MAVLPRLDELKGLQRTKVALAATRRDHDTANNADAILVALCQRCQISLDRPEQKLWWTLFPQAGRWAPVRLFDETDVLVVPRHSPPFYARLCRSATTNRT